MLTEETKHQNLNHQYLIQNNIPPQKSFKRADHPSANVH